MMTMILPDDGCSIGTSKLAVCVFDSSKGVIKNRKAKRDSQKTQKKDISVPKNTTRKLEDWATRNLLISLF